MTRASSYPSAFGSWSAQKAKPSSNQTPSPVEEKDLGKVCSELEAWLRKSGVLVPDHVPVGAVIIT